mgnify:CR=1 FL=1
MPTSRRCHAVVKYCSVNLSCMERVKVVYYAFEKSNQMTAILFSILLSLPLPLNASLYSSRYNY